MYRKIEGYLAAWKEQKDRKPLILQGARQTGKTYSLKKFGQESFAHCHYLNFEKDANLKKIFEPDLNPQRIIREISFYLDNSIDINTDLIIMDEIQECPQAMTSLKYFAEEIPGAAIAAAGSLLGLHLGLKSFPVGKVNFIKMFPLSFEEFLLGVGEEKSYNFLRNHDLNQTIPEIIHDHLWKMLIQYLIIGGLPEIIKTYSGLRSDLYAACQAARTKQSDLITAYLADMAKHSGKENSSHIQRVWENIPAQLARNQDGSAAKFKFKGVVPGIKGFNRLSGPIDWLKAAGLIASIPIVNKAALPLSAYIKENAFKLYFFDVGLLGTISRLDPKTIMAYSYGTYKGYYMENFVVQEFWAAQKDNFACWQENTAEVEFLQEFDGKIIPLEIKSGWVTQAKSLKIFREKYAPPFSVIFSARNTQIDKTKKIYRLPAYLAGKLPKLLDQLL